MAHKNMLLNTEERSINSLLKSTIRKKGGWVNSHLHADRAFTINLNNFQIYKNKTLIEKWKVVDELKHAMTTDDYYRNICLATEHMIKQGVTAMGSFIDIDPICEDRAIIAAIKAKEVYKSDITLKLINQTLKGVIDKEARYWFDKGADLVDIIGGLPRLDQEKYDQSDIHLDILMKTGKQLGKMVHVHVDQFNSQVEKETEQLVDKTLEHNMHGRVVAIHGISIAAHNIDYRQSLYEKMKKAKLMVIACPFAWIDSPRREELGPTRNSLTPVDELSKAGIVVAIGTDNISDYMIPFSDGDMWEELRLLISGCRYTDLDGIIDIATINGRKVLGI